MLYSARMCALTNKVNDRQPNQYRLALPTDAFQAYKYQHQTVVIHIHTPKRLVSIILSSYYVRRGRNTTIPSRRPDLLILRSHFTLPTPNLFSLL